MTQVRDVAIVGGGLLGLAAGRALTGRGHDVVVLEQAGHIGHPGSGSKGTSRIFRLGYPDPAYVTAARAARELWQQIEAESGARVLHPAPQLTFGAGLDAVHGALRAAGAPGELLSAEVAARRFPALRTGGPALLEPDSAVIAADEALAALAARAGEIRTGVRVLSLADDGRRVTLRTADDALSARIAIVTAGPWSGRLLESAGIAVPIRTTLEEVAYFRPLAAPAARAGTAPIFMRHDQGAPYGLPVPGSPLYKIGIHHGGPVTDPDAQHQDPDEALTARIAAAAARYLPGYEPQPARIERCVYDNTPDEDFVVDRVGNVVIGCGTSGHGFKFGPLLGQWLAALAAGPPGGPDPALRTRFAAGRFRTTGLPGGYSVPWPPAPPPAEWGTRG